MGEMAAGRKRHAKNGIAGLEPSKIHGIVGLGARVGLNIGVVGMEKSASAVNREAFDAVNILLPAIVAVIW